MIQTCEKFHFWAKFPLLLGRKAYERMKNTEMHIFISSFRKIKEA
jgi:hypothetical protein